MKVYETSDIRNVATVGHAGSGKTSLIEALLFKSGAITRKGSVEDRNTLSDHNEIEQDRNSSIFSTPLFIEWNDKKINIIDTPGYDDYIGEMIAPIHVCDTGMVVLNSQTGVEVGAELAWNYAAKFNKPMFIVINKLDIETDFPKIIDDIKTSLTASCKIVQFPVKTGANFNTVIDVIKMKQIVYDENGKATESDIPADLQAEAENYRNELVESIAETSEDLMNHYFENGDLSAEEFERGFKAGIKNRLIVPILCASGKNNVGLDGILNFITSYLPAPNELPLFVAEGSKEVKCDPNAPTSLFVYKLFSDSKLGDMTYFRVNTGKLVQSADMIIAGSGQNERIGQIFYTKGKNRIDAPHIVAGDLGATVKLKNTKINNTLYDKNFDVSYKEIAYPNPKIRIAVVPKTKGEEEKVGVGLHALSNEDPTVIIEHSKELRQTIVYCQGELHSGVIKYRLLNRYKVEAEYIEPRVPYRETIQKSVDNSYRHKKQSGGAGQFAEVHMRIEPWVENMPNPAGLTVRGKELIDLEWGGKLEYVNCIVGGVIDARFMPAILKGVMEKMQFGPLTGSYVRDVRVSIFDGKMHPVDSNETAFKMAGTMAFKDGFINAAPKILEPIYSVEIKVPSNFVGDIMSDLPSRRGVILGSDTEGHYQKIKARMPLAELDKYSTALRSMTQARATYTSEFLEYAPVPPNIQADLIEAYKKIAEEEG